MAIKDIQKYIDDQGLVETSDEESEKPIYRRPGFEGIRGFREIEKIFSHFIREHREAKRLNRAQVGMMVGLHETIFARYERAFSKLQRSGAMQSAISTSSTSFRSLSRQASHGITVLPQQMIANRRLARSGSHRTSERRR